MPFESVIANAPGLSAEVIALTMASLAFVASLRLMLVVSNISAPFNAGILILLICLRKN
jgi:hypothetical protein